MKTSKAMDGIVCLCPKIIAKLMLKFQPFKEILFHINIKLEIWC